ncbi:hypothetical protein BHM03_00013607 [Ensete ventricosum]|nr:hypothetical protein BHM03_00013607 [Ensete ventricosum]
MRQLVAFRTLTHSPQIPLTLLRERLRLVNQRIDDVCKDEGRAWRRSPLWLSLYSRNSRCTYPITLLPPDAGGVRWQLQSNGVRGHYVIVDILVAEKREDQKRPRAKPSRGPPPGLPRRRMERDEARVEDRDRIHYCRFHRDYGHDTEEFYDLKNQIEDLTHRGHLDKYIMKPREPSLHPKGPVKR